MAAYAALLSLSHILHDILHPPPTHQFILPRKQIESLQERLNFLIDFLESYTRTSGKEIEELEVRITDAVYSTEDVIESTVGSQVRGSICYRGCPNPMMSYLRGMKFKKLIRGMVKEFDFIQKETLKMKEMKGVENLQPRNSLTAATSSRPLHSEKTTVVGFDKHLYEIMGALAEDETRCRIIPVVGMGGIGKTTIATLVYNDPFIVEHFYVRAWITISQEYTVRELLLQLLNQIHKAGLHSEETADEELGLQVHKALFGRRYLIVMDDMWSIQACEKLKMFLPGNENGCRILVTTRLSNLAEALDSCTPYKMDFLDEQQSWDLLHNKIFAADQDCPSELEEIGKDIAKRCGGLPLALVVIGGLLGKTERTRENWESVARDVASSLNSRNNEQVMNILSLSYIRLPVHLKPGFLYLAMVPEDCEVRVSTLVRLWVAEGLIKLTTQAKVLEEVAQEYLEDLISRNLVLVSERGSTGKVKLCKIHDLVRDLCIIKAKKEKFLHTVSVDNPNISPNVATMRRLGVIPSKQERKTISVNAFQSSNFNRSLLCYSQLSGYSDALKTRFICDPDEWSQVSEVVNGFTFLKVVLMNDRKIHIDISKLNNLRYVAAWSASRISALSLCWNLQTLVLPEDNIVLPAEIWQMTQLRHLEMAVITIPDPPDDPTMNVLENLQTLKTIANFKCTEQVSQRIPNLKELRILCDVATSGTHYLQNLVCFKNLESLSLDGAEKFRTDIAFPTSLKKLILVYCKISWEDLSVVGLLPNLEVLKLWGDTIEGEEWNPIEGEFRRLKFLLLRRCELKIWRAENHHFPCLESLHLRNTKKLEEIPMSFAEILPLEVIKLYPSEGLLWSSAKKISDERELLGYEPLKLGKFWRKGN